jgi:3-methyladenine DNA glycosylase/8-oxoguanine DNA glycosylase
MTSPVRCAANVSSGALTTDVVRPLRLSPDVLEAGRRHLCAADARLAALIRQVGPCALRPRGQIYRSLFRAVLYQQLAGNAAGAIERRVRALFGGRIPPPAEFSRAARPELRRAGLSRQKLAYLRDLAKTFTSGKLRAQQLARLTDEEVIAAVTVVRGIGEWTAHMLLLFSLGRPDVLPVGDYGVRKGVQRLYGLRELPERRTLERIAAPWRPYRSIASWYVWRSIDTQTPDGGGW